MNNSRLSSKVNSSAWEQAQKIPFHVLVAYEDAATRDRALHLSHHLSRQLAQDYDFHCSWWKFEHLANSILREQAANAALEANMIVIAIRARPAPPPLQGEWLRSWLPRRPIIKAALVALVGTTETTQADEIATTTTVLQSAAKSAKLDFFSHNFELPHSLGTNGRISAAEAAAVSVADQSNPFRMPIPRWGINE